MVFFEKLRFPTTPGQQLNKTGCFLMRKSCFSLVFCGLLLGAIGRQFGNVCWTWPTGCLWLNSFLGEGQPPFVVTCSPPSEFLQVESACRVIDLAIFSFC